MPSLVGLPLKLALELIAAQGIDYRLNPYMPLPHNSTSYRADIWTNTRGVVTYVLFEPRTRITEIQT